MRKIVKVLGHVAAWIVYVLSRKESGPVVLLYHSIEDSSWPWSVAPKDFEKQIAWLKKNRTIVTLDQVVAHAKGETVVPKNSVAITFDDGYKDTLTTALPVLEKYRVPATLFLTTDLDLVEPFNGMARPSWKDVEALAAHELITIEAHGHSHLMLTKYEDDRETVFDEWRACNELIKKYTGRKPRYLAYAFGAKSRKLYTLAEEFGYSAVFSAHEGAVQSGDDIFGLRRVLIERNIPHLLFMLRTSGAVEMYRRLKSV